MYDHEENWFGHDMAPTTQELVREWASQYGSAHTDQQWLLSDWDTWERNPHYVGPEQRHPEDYVLDIEREEDYEPLSVDVHREREYTWPDYVAGDSLDIPF